MRRVGGALALRGRKRKENMWAKLIFALATAAWCGIGFATAKKPVIRH